jgi:hypothetical protein
MPADVVAQHVAEASVVSVLDLLHLRVVEQIEDVDDDAEVSLLADRGFPLDP